VPRAAVGFSSHLGWSAAVAVVGSRSRIEVALRRVLVLVDPDVDESHEPWHKAAEAGDPDSAREIVRRGTRGVEGRARQEIAALLREVEALGHRVVGAGLLRTGSERELRFESILAAHAMQHAAEGRLVRDALVRACEKRGVPVVAVPSRELLAAAAKRLGQTEKALAAALAGLGRELGPPWRKDQKDAALVAWMALSP
jgi:hypothetical protein